MRLRINGEPTKLEAEDIVEVVYRPTGVSSTIKFARNGVPITMDPGTAGLPFYLQNNWKEPDVFNAHIQQYLELIGGVAGLAAVRMTSTHDAQGMTYRAVFRQEA